MEKQYTKD